MQLIAEGSSKLASVPSGGGGGGAAAAGAAAGGAAEEAPKEEAKEEGTYHYRRHDLKAVLTFPQRRRSPMTTWASASSTKQLATIAIKSIMWLFPRQASHTCAYLRHSWNYHGVCRDVGLVEYPSPWYHQRGLSSV